MPHWPIVQHALVTPTRCVGCMTNRCAEGFADTLAEIPGYGRVYVCASCIGQAAHQLGHLPPKVKAEWAQERDDDRAEIERLRAELVFEREHKTVSADDLQAWVTSTGVAKPVTPTFDVTIDPLVCPDCGNAKGPTSKQCRACYMAAAKTGATA